MLIIDKVGRGDFSRPKGRLKPPLPNIYSVLGSFGERAPHLYLGGARNRIVLVIQYWDLVFGI
jgi:hypothetical protein